MPADYELTGPVIEALLARLQDPLQLNTEIQAIRAGIERKDEKESLVAVDPGNVFDFVPPPSYLTAFPSIGIEDASSMLEDDTGSTATGLHTIGIVVFCSDPDQHILAWELRRYVRAIVHTCLAGRTLGTGSPLAAWGTGFQRIAWGPTLASTASPQTWMSFALFTMWARREEIG